MKSFRVKGRHFIILIIVFTMILHIIVNMNQSNTSHSIVEDTIPELRADNFLESINHEELCLVLYYIENCNSCQKMLSHLIQLKDRTVDNTKIYKINVDKYKEIGYKHSISGVPSILIFKKGKEEKRIFGIISSSNLEMIYKRHVE